MKKSKLIFALTLFLTVILLVYPVFGGWYFITCEIEYPSIKKEK